MLIAGDGLDTAEFMDLGATKTLTTAPVPGNLPVVMKGPVANLVAGKVVACGGAGVAGCYEYDFQVGDWAHLGDMPEVRSSSVDFVSNDGDTWYILGGRADATTPHTYHKTALAYHNGEFKDAGSMPYPAYAGCAVRVNSTHTLVAGGKNSANSALKVAYLLEVATWEWTQLDDMDQGR